MLCSSPGTVPVASVKTNVGPNKQMLKRRDGQSATAVEREVPGGGRGSVKDGPVQIGRASGRERV